MLKLWTDANLFTHVVSEGDSRKFLWRLWHTNGMFVISTIITFNEYCMRAYYRESCIWLRLITILQIHCHNLSPDLSKFQSEK